MKKRTKTLLALTAALSASVMFGALAACGDGNGGGNTAHTHVDADQDGYCDECHEQIGGNGGPQNPSSGTFDVSFETNGGSGIPTQAVEKGGKATRPGEPKRFGYVFGGWYTDDSFQKEFNFDEEITADTTVWAKWTDAEATAESYFDFADTEGGVSISVKTGQVLPADTVLPAEYNNKAVVEIAERAFEGQAQISGVKIPASVKKIGTQAFRNCEKLEYVTGAENVEEIGANAFFGSVWDLGLPVGEVYLGKTLYKYAGSLYDDTVITVKEGTAGIAAGAFADMEKLVGIVLPEGLKNIGSYALGGSGKGTGLTSVVLPDSVEYVAENAFRNDGKLEEITIGKSLKEIGQYAFAGTAIGKVVFNATDATLSVAPFAGLENRAELVIGDELAEIPVNLTKEWPGLEKVTLGAKITELSENMFKGASGLREIVLPETITSIGNSALEGTGITELTIPASVTSIGAKAFAQCLSLGKVYYNAKDAQGTSEAGHPFEGCKVLDTVEFGPQVEKIPAYLFMDCPLVSLSLGRGVTEIGEKAFVGTTLAELDLRNVKTVGAQAFYQVPLGNINLRKVEKIGAQAFSGMQCFELIIPESVTEIGVKAFSDTMTLNRVVYNAVNAVQVLTEENPAYDRMFSGVSYLDTVIIGQDVRNIPDYFMYNNTKITSIAFPTFMSGKGAAVNVGDYAFYGCKALETVTNSDNIARTGAAAFDETPWVDSYAASSTDEFVKIGSTLHRWKPKNMPAYTPDGIPEDKQLTIEIPDDVTRISDNCFTEAISDWLSPWSKVFSAWDQKSMKEAKDFPYEGLQVPIKAVTFKEGSRLESIGKYAFRGFGLLKSIKLPETVKEIGEYAFYQCLRLESVDFGENPSLESIGAAAFKNCISLRNLQLPETLKSLGVSSLYGVGGKIVIPESCTDIDVGVFAPNTTIGSQPDRYDGGYNYGIFANLEELEIKAPIEKVPNGLCAFQTNLTKVTLPDTVTEIGNYAFNTTGIISIDLSHVTKIGQYAFMWRNGGGSPLDNNSLQNVTFNPDVETIGQGAFNYCKALEGDFVFNKLTNLQTETFQYCGKINSLTFKELGSLGTRSVGYCTGLTALDLGPKLTSITGAFNGNYTNLKVLHLPATLVDISSALFSTANQGPLFLYLDGKVEPASIPAKCFDGVTYIVAANDLYDSYIAEGSKWAAYSSKFIKEADVRESDGYYFVSDAYVKYYSGDRENVVLPASVDNITSILDIFGTAEAYAACKNFSLAEGHTNLKFADGALLSQDGTILYAYFGGENTSVLNTVTKIADYAFCGKLTDTDTFAKINSALTAVEEIGQYAFKDCTGITDISAFLSKKIGGYAFSGVSVESLTLTAENTAAMTGYPLRELIVTNLKLENGVDASGGKTSPQIGTITAVNVEIHTEKFSQSIISAVATKSVVFGSEVKTYPARLLSSFAKGPYVEFITFEGTADGMTIAKSTFAATALPNLIAVFVPEGQDEAFKQIENLSDVADKVCVKNLDDGQWIVGGGKILRYEGDYTTVEIPKEVTAMDNIFDIFGTPENLLKCTSLTVNEANTAFKISDTEDGNMLMTEDGSVLYYYMGEKTELNLKCAVRAGAFTGKDDLTFTVEVPATITEIDSILDIFGQLEYFARCTSLTLAAENSGLKLENNLLTNTDGTEVYYYMGKEKELSLPNATKIGAYAFYRSASLEKLTLGTGVTEIGDGAFVRCAYNFTLVLNTVNVPVFGENVFGKYSIEFLGSIQVPSESVASYQDNSKLKAYTSLIAGIPAEE